MNAEIKNYVNDLFPDIPNELKEEILFTVSDVYEGSIQEGKTEKQAYDLVISKLEDIDKRIANISANENSIKELSDLEGNYTNLLNNITQIYWITITTIYLLISFLTGRWDISWIIWLPASIVPLILKTIFEMKYGYK